MLVFLRAIQSVWNHMVERGYSTVFVLSALIMNLGWSTAAYSQAPYSQDNAYFLNQDPGFFGTLPAGTALDIPLSYRIGALPSGATDFDMSLFNWLATFGSLPQLGGTPRDPYVPVEVNLLGFSWASDSSDLNSDDDDFGNRRSTLYVPLSLVRKRDDKGLELERSVQVWGTNRKSPPDESALQYGRAKRLTESLKRRSATQACDGGCNAGRGRMRDRIVDLNFSMQEEMKGPRSNMAPDRTSTETLKEIFPPICHEEIDLLQGITKKYFPENLLRGPQDITCVCPEWDNLSLNDRKNVMIALVTAVMLKESSCNNKNNGKGWNGTAYGLCQAKTKMSAKKNALWCIKTISNTVTKTGYLYSEDRLLNYFAVLNPRIHAYKTLEQMDKLNVCKAKTSESILHPEKRKPSQCGHFAPSKKRKSKAKRKAGSTS